MSCLNDLLTFFKKKKIVSLVDESTFGGTVKNQNISAEELVEGFHKPIIRKINKAKIHSPFIDNIGVQIEPICMINASKNVLNETKCKLNEIWVDKGSEFYNRSIKSFLHNNDMEMRSMHNEAKSVEGVIRALKNIIYKCMTSVSKNVFIDKSDDIIDKYNYTHNCAIIKTPKPINVKTRTYLDSSKKLTIQT